MKNSVCILIKKCLLLYVLFNFMLAAISFFSSTLVNLIYNVRVFDFSFYELQPIYFQIIFAVMNLYILFIAAIRYFHLFLSFINSNQNENDFGEANDKECDNTEEKEALQKRQKAFSKRVMFIVTCVIASFVMSSLIQILGMLNRY